MALFRKSSTDTTIPEDLKPYYEGRNTSWRRWVGPVLRGLVLLAAVVLIVWGGIWGVNKLVHHKSDDKGTTATSTSQSADKSGTSSNKSTSGSQSGSGSKQKAPAASTTPSTSGSAGSSSSAGRTPTNPAAPAGGTGSSSTTTPATTSNGQLANTGPGEVIAAVFGTIVLATFAYYFVSAYRVSGARK